MIKAVGDPSALSLSLERSDDVQAYKSYVETYSLGWDLDTSDEIKIGAYKGSVELHYAKPVSPQGHDRPSA